MRYFGIDPNGAPAASAQAITKENNAKQIFNVVARAGSISRAQLSKIVGLSPSTVSVLTDELIRNHILLEAGAGQSAPTGRKPIMLEVDPSGLQIPCFAFRPTGLQYVLYDLKFNVIEQHLQPYVPELRKHRNSYITPANEVILNLFTSVLERSQHLDMSKVPIFTISFYGAFLRDTGMYTSSVLGWHLSDTFVDELRAMFNNIPLLIGNNAALMAYAEKSMLDNERENLLYLHFDDGVGAGIIFNRRPLVGECGISGEIGHMRVSGTQLETAASAQAILSLLQQNTAITDLASAGRSLTVGDQYTADILRGVAALIAEAINNTLCMLGSMDVCIGGKVTELGPVFLDLIRSALQEFGFRRVLPHSPVRMSLLDENGDCLGAARAYVDNVFTVTLP